MKDLFCEIIEIKNPSSSVERKKIVELANEHINHIFDDILSQKYENLERIDKNVDNKYENNDNNKKVLILKTIDVEIENLRIDDGIIDEISDILSGLASYSLFIEANRLLQIIASKMIINYQNKVNNFQIEDISLADTYNKTNEDLAEIINIHTSTENEINNNENNYNYTENKNKTLEINAKKEIKNEKNEKWNLSFPCVYGQAYGKQVLLEALLWPRKYSSLYRSLSPTGKQTGCDIRECDVIYCNIIE